MSQLPVFRFSPVCIPLWAHYKTLFAYRNSEPGSLHGIIRKPGITLEKSC
jgi:hypothetical protein